MSRKKNSETLVYVDENYFRNVDKVERWRQEYEYWQSVEKKLASVSSLTFEPVDYTQALVQVPWKDQPMMNFEHLIEEARIAVESRFLVPILAHLVVLAVAFFMLLINDKSIALWISGVTFVIGAVSLFRIVRVRHNKIISVLDETTAEVARRNEEERKKRSDAKRRHEAAEEERITHVQRLLRGEPGAVILQLDSILPNLDLPLPIEVDIELYENTPLIKVWLPPATVIPIQAARLLPSGRIAYDDKEQRNVNKQYLELCAALVVKIACRVFEAIPGFECGYVWGLTREHHTKYCLISTPINRERLVEACQAGTGIAALSRLNARFASDTSFRLSDIEPDIPDGWEELSPQNIRNLHVKIFK